VECKLQRGRRAQEAGGGDERERAKKGAHAKQRPC